MGEIKSEVVGKIRKSPVLKAKSLYQRKTISTRVQTKKGVTLEDLVANKHDGEERLKRNTFFRYCVEQEKSKTAHGDRCRACQSSDLRNNAREGEIVCARCGLVQSERAVVGTYSDVERVLMPSAVIGDMLHINYSYGMSIKDAIAKHPLTCHWSDVHVEQFAHLILKCINNVWNIVAEREVSGTRAFLITHGAQFAQENHTMPAAATVVNIVIQYKMNNVLIEHLYTKFLVDQLDHFKEQGEEVKDTKVETVKIKTEGELKNESLHEAS